MAKVAPYHTNSREEPPAHRVEACNLHLARWWFTSRRFSCAESSPFSGYRFYFSRFRASRSTMLREMTATGLHAWLLPRVQALPGISNDSRVLDLGCGTGAWLQRLHDSGIKDLTGIDCKRERFAAQARFVCANFDQAERKTDSAVTT
jgi:2-polyprenyl-3-methyl-5-hydroxy-6-metoxy-1,4-benzoquinol methylase